MENKVNEVEKIYKELQEKLETYKNRKIELEQNSIIKEYKNIEHEISILERDCDRLEDRLGCSNQNAKVLNLSNNETK